MADGADDLDIAVELVNTLYVLATPPDRLTAVDVFQEILRGLGHPELAQLLRPGDLERLRRLRERLWPVFAATSTAEAAGLLNPMLRQAGAVPQLVEDVGGGWDLRMGADRRGIEALEARLPAALSLHVAGHGTRRLGVCHATPCQCVYVDRTRPGTRRFCCDQCNDRAAATAYRSRGKC
jgi:predicted RNA-binding Zn ribbon-like protein